MGQKVNPTGFRLPVNRAWRSRWFAPKKAFSAFLVEDQQIREYVKKRFVEAALSKIMIERYANRVRVSLFSARPGVIIGKKGQDVDRVRQDLEKMTKKEVYLEIKEVRDADADAQLVAENIAQQLEKRIGFRRAMKNAMGRAMRMGALGIKVSCAGRLGGAEIARTETYHEGTIPLQTLCADIEYGFAEAATTYGRVGVKVWVYKGEVLTTTLRTTPRTMDTTKPFKERRERREGGRRDNRDNRGGFNRDNRGGRDNRGQGGFNRGGRDNRAPRAEAPKEGGND